MEITLALTKTSTVPLSSKALLLPAIVARLDRQLRHSARKAWETSAASPAVKLMGRCSVTEW